MDNLNYYKLYTSTSFCGTDETVLIVANYEYEDFIAECEVTLEKLTKEEFDQEAEENGWDIEMYKI